MRAWHALMDRDLLYQMPVRVTRERTAGPGFAEDAFHMNEDWYSLETRVSRLESEYAWAEDPPSRTRRFVTNVRVRPGEREDEIDVKSNLLIYRSRGDTANYFIVSAERRDTLRRVDGELKILKRVILLDHTTLGMPNLGIFF
jgi:3-phenylpropionate/cinnamic acid dioxygenase small subunit